MTSEAVELAFKVLGTCAIALMTFFLGIFSFAYQKRTKAIDETIGDVALLKLQVTELVKRDIPATLQRHDMEIEALTERLESLTTSIEAVRQSTAHIDRNLATLAADTAHNRQTIDRLDGHLTELLRHPSNPPRSPRNGA